MGRYALRDLLGHFVKRRGEGKMCQHPCCKGRRPHPDKLPVILDRKTLRSLSDEELARHVRWDNQKSVDQVMAEMERRDREIALKRDRYERARMRRSLEQEEHRLALHAAYLDAEHQTRGHMLSREGLRKGVDPRTLFTGSQSRVDRYASEELREYFHQHGRLTAGEWRRQQRQQREEYEYEAERARRREVSRQRAARRAA